MVNGNKDLISREIVRTLNDIKEPLETKEIELLLIKKINDITRTKLFYRLMLLRGEGLISGKFVGPGKGVWIWWKKSELFK